MNTEKLSNENETEALNKHVVMQALPLAVRSQTSARPLCKDRCNWPDCTLDGCVVRGEPRG
jgi:hypothetical protein